MDPILVPAQVVQGGSGIGSSPLTMVCFLFFLRAFLIAKCPEAGTVLLLRLQAAGTMVAIEAGGIPE